MIFLIFNKHKHFQSKIVISGVILNSKFYFNLKVCHPCSSLQMKREIVLYSPSNQPNNKAGTKPVKTSQPLSTK